MGLDSMCGSRQQEPPRVALDSKNGLHALFLPACALCGTPCSASIGNAPSHATTHKQQTVEGERWREGASGTKYMEQERGIDACLYVLVHA